MEGTNDVIDPEEFAQTFAFEPSLEVELPNRPALFSSHGHVLIAIARQPAARLAQIAAHVELSEAHVRRLLADLVDSGLVSAQHVGTQMHYTVTIDAHRCTDARAPLGPVAVERLYGVSRA